MRGSPRRRSLNRWLPLTSSRTTSMVHRSSSSSIALATGQEADAEALPYPDGAFDVVLSCLGVMFAPDHRASAAELLRVCRPGGTIGLVNWTPAGFIGRMFATMKPYAAPPPPGAQPPPL